MVRIASIGGFFITDRSQHVRYVNNTSWKSFTITKCRGKAGQSYLLEDYLEKTRHIWCVVNPCGCALESQCSAKWTSRHRHENSRRVTIFIRLFASWDTKMGIIVHLESSQNLIYCNLFCTGSKTPRLLDYYNWTIRETRLNRCKKSTLNKLLYNMMAELRKDNVSRHLVAPGREKILLSVF